MTQQTQNTQQTLLFYDIESSGLSKPFDQVMQFAAIRTDMDFNEISRHEIVVKMNPDVFCAPGAFITHRISPEICKKGLTEDKALFEIHQLLNTPGTISLGYNTLAFDDEFLRFSFYRNLLPPYTHQYLNNCSRCDVYPILILFYLYLRPVLTWPEVDGRVSMKLENIAAENGFLEGQAHDAMVDVEATIELAKKLKNYSNESKTMWNYVLGYFDKKTDQSRIQKLPSALISQQSLQMGLYTLPKLGNRVQFQAPVIYLGQHRHYKNQSRWLRLDLPELLNTHLDNIPETTWALNKKFGEPGIILPYIEKYTRKIKLDRKTIIENNIEFLNQHPALFKAIQKYHLEFKYSVDPETDIEAGLYQSDFWTPLDTKLCKNFHQAESVQDKIKILEKLTHPDLKSLGYRLLGRCYNQNKDYLVYLNNLWDLEIKNPKIYKDFQGNIKRTYAQALLECTELLEPKQSSNNNKKSRKLDAEQLKLIDLWKQFWCEQEGICLK